ncbi:arsenate reductase (glutaredoxin) [uncultured Maribacter sp.]|uniref:arsenate reductase (glutaredoxin) n=1 Tax=uncultured Maribacter sp. TaxID=431308 RepID=UPI0026359B29|nr:arsenate reductase (glutaredoxin) [uncultured Maribacter sp.]
MITIYHNPRCSKSRQGLQALENSGKEFTIKKYLEDVPSEKELKDIIDKLKISPLELVRKNEAVWKELYKGKSLSDAEIIKVMATHPKLIERPIVIKNNTAVIGRPLENITNLLDK